MAEGFGGPVWHASGRGGNERASVAIALAAIRGVGDPGLGEWIDRKGTGSGIVHVQRRLTDAEREAFAVPEPFDVRGTDEEVVRIGRVLDEAPHLRGHLERIYGKALAR